ncbi:hypothetical protein LCL61_18095 [Amycolatopsis coloradensis]|uniref:Uncharacterized protein n=1 Tax=Amycolatopsis coloradensis TaxID=76021 RepID=A0ACD5BDU9_9PSEU
MSDSKAARPRCKRKSRSGDSCKGIVSYSAPLRQYAPSCRQHMAPEEREAFDKDPLWNSIGQVIWLLRQAERNRLPPLRTIEVAGAMRIHQTRASELLNDLERLRRVSAMKKGRQVSWSIGPGEL